MDDVKLPRAVRARVGSRQSENAEGRIEALVAEHYGFIWRLLRRLGLSPADAEDEAQQVFMIAARKVDSIPSGRGRAFLYATAVRVASNARRSRTRRREAHEPPPEAASAAERGPEHMAELSRAKELLDALLDQLPDELRRPLVLAEIEQLETSEIAELEQVKLGTAASRLRRARARFRELLGKHATQNPFRSDQ